MKVLSIGIVFSAALAFQAAGAEKAGRLSGSVVNFSRDQSEISIRQGTATRTVKYSAATRFNAASAGNTAKASPSSPDQVAVGNYLTCVGSWDGVKLDASNCTVRPSKRP